MPDKLTALRIKQQDGTYSAQIPVGALAENVAYNSSYSVRNVLGNVEMSKGSVQEQLNSFDSKIGTQVSEWLEENVQMASGVDIDQTLTVAGQAADAQAAGKLLTVDNESTVSATKFKVTTTTQTYNLLTDEDIDATLTQSGAAADAKVTGDGIADLKSALNIVKDDAYNETAMTVAATISGWRLNESDGLCSANENYKIVKYAVAAGDIVWVESDDRFQFQTVATVPDRGTSNRVGTTYGAGEYLLEVPNTATYLIFSTPVNSSAVACYVANSNIDALNAQLLAVYQEYTLSGWQKGVFNASGSIVSSFNGTVSPSTVYVVGTKVHLEENCYATVAYYGDSGYIGKVAANGSINQTADDWKYFTSDFNSFDYAPSGAKFIQIALYVTDSTTITTDNVQTWTNSNCTLYKPIPIQNSIDIEKINDQIVGTYTLANWIKGTESGTGDILTSYNSTLSPERVYIVEAHVSLTENCNATLFFYNDTEYLGKVGASGSVNKTGGDWKYFTGDFDPSYYAPSTAKYFRLSLFPQDGTTINSENVQTWTNNNCTITYLIPVKNKIDISTYGGDIEEINNRYGRYTHAFTPPASTGHSSRNDGVYVDIEQGEPFTVKISGLVAGQPEIYAFYNNQANYSKLGLGLEWVGVAPHAVEYIGVAYTDQATFPSGSITIEVYKNNQTYGKTQKISDYKNIITTVLGADIPNDINKYTVSSAYATKMKEAIDAWMASYAGDDQAIPFIVHTDQHGRLTAAQQGIFNLLDYLVNWDGISAIFNLGDTVVDHWEDDNTNANPLLRNATLEAARICLENIPKEKRIDVYGNHDTWYFNGSVYTPVEGTLPSMQYNNPYFPSDGLITRKCPDNSGLAVVCDTKRNVKYLILAGWDYADKTGTHVGYQWYWINQKHLNWIVDEMSKNDGYDLILVSHVPLQMGGAGCINPITGDSISETVPFYITHYDPYLLPLWNARKNKTSGTVSSNGVSVTYDFTGCESDCICALSGHAHYDGAQYIQNAATGLLDVAFDWFFNNTIHFGIIDRNSRKIKVWKLANDSTPTVTPWELPLDYSVDYRSKSFRVEKNVTHSALNDKMPVNIASGERFTVKVTGPISACQIFGFLNGSYIMIAQNVFTYTGTASQAFDEIGISIGGQYILGTGDVLFEAYKS